MAELTTLARPYAKAAFEYARDNNALAQWSNALATAAAVAQHDAVQQLLSSPNRTPEQKGARFAEVCGDALDAHANNFILHLAHNGRLVLLPQIYELFEQFKADHEKSIDVELVTAFPISDEQSGKLVDALKTKLGRDVTLQTEVDDSLLGGAVVRAGDVIIDGSVRGRLAKLAEATHG